MRRQYRRPLAKWASGAGKRGDYPALLFVFAYRPTRSSSRYLKQTALRLRDDFDSDVPKTVDELCSLPGVGPKMAFLALQVAWNL